MEGFYPADQIVIAGRLGCGKSALANILLRSLKDRNPWAKLLFLYWTMEMPGYQQIARIYSNEFSTPVKGIFNSRIPLEESMWQNVKRFGETLNGYNVYFREWPVSADEWKECVLNIQAMFPTHTIVNIYDHIRLLKKGNETSEEQRISNLMSAGVFVKNKIDCINIFLSQMNRNIENPGNGDRRDVGSSAPMASDIFGSDAIGQYSTVIIALHRPELYGKSVYRYSGTDINAENLMACHVLKQRDGWTGLITWDHDLKNNKIFDRRPQTQPT